MLKMKIRRVDHSNDNTPILSNREIEEFAHAVLADYKPKLLREPAAVSFQHFLESYLGVTLIFRDIFNSDPEKQILAMTVFRDGTVKLFDRENNRISNSIMRANTVIIDNSVMQPGKEGLALFTGLHEGGHILMHPKVYGPFRAGQVCCRRETVESVRSGGNSQWSSEQWLEHQANYFAAALAMPNATFIPFVNQLMREHNLWKGYIITGRDDDLDIFAKDILPERISEVYGVSKRAAYIKLKKVGFVSE